MQLTALVLAVLAQAEPAPPAQATPSTPPPQPAPVAPVPAVGAPEVIAVPPTAVSVGLRLAYRAGPAGRELPPAFGFSLGATFEHRYVARSWLELGAALDLYHDRFARGVTGSSMVEPGVEVPYESTRVVSQTSFALLQTVGLRQGRWRPWLAAGGGLTIGYFSSAELRLRPGELRGYLPLVRGAAGLEVEVAPFTYATARVEYSRMLAENRFTPREGDSLRVFGDLVDVGVGFAYRF